MGNMEKLFNARRVAIIGASLDRRKAGGAILENLGRYDLELFPVNPRYDKFQGNRWYKNLDDVEEDLDLAIICLPARGVSKALRECVKKEVKYSIIIAGGFGEVGERELEDELKAIIDGSKTRLLGPNTLGVYNPGVIDTMFLSRKRCKRPGKGEIALISQSGATASILMDSCSLHDIGFSSFVGIGNRADIDENELVQHFATDPTTGAMALYIESFADARELLEIADRVDKPIVVLKAGRSEEGSKAVLSHTGSLAKSRDGVIEGIFKQHGITRALDEVELIDYAKALAYSEPICGTEIAILTSAGGPGVIATDYLLEHSLALAKLSEETRGRLKEIALPFASVENPIDLTASLTADDWKKALGILSDAREVDAILALTFFQPLGADEYMIEALKHAKKPIVSVSIGGKYTFDLLKRYEEIRIPAYPTIKEGVKVLRVLVDRGEYLRKRREKVKLD